MSFLPKLQLDYRTSLAQEGVLVNFTVSRGQELILWRNYIHLYQIIGQLSDDNILGRDAFRKYAYENYGFEDVTNSISATQDGEWLLHQFYAGKDQSIFVCMKDQMQFSKVHGQYVAWSTIVLRNVDATYKPVIANTNYVETMRIDANGNLSINNTPMSITSHPITVQNVMQCQHCGGITNDVDIEYLSGTDHLECVLKDLDSKYPKTIK